MNQNIPLFIGIGLAVAWLTVILYGIDALYRRKSPLFIIYWGTWICYVLWHMKISKTNPTIEMHGLIKVILFIFFAMGGVFAIFGSDKDTPPPQRRGE